MSVSRGTIDFVVFDLPYPTSANAMYRINKRFGTPYKSTKYKTFIAEVHLRWYDIANIGHYDFGEEILLGVIRFPPRKGCDSDNIQKTLQDALESVKAEGMKPGFRGAFKNDNMIVGDRKECGQRIKDGLVRVYLCTESRRAEFEERFKYDSALAIEGRKKDAGKLSPAPVSLLTEVID